MASSIPLLKELALSRVLRSINEEQSCELPKQITRICELLQREGFRKEVMSSATDFKGLVAKRSAPEPLLFQVQKLFELIEEEIKVRKTVQLLKHSRATGQHEGLVSRLSAQGVFSVTQVRDSLTHDLSFGLIKGFINLLINPQEENVIQEAFASAILAQGNVKPEEAVQAVNDMFDKLAIKEKAGWWSIMLESLLTHAEYSAQAIDIGKKICGFLSLELKEEILTKKLSHDVAKMLA